MAKVSVSEHHARLVADTAQYDAAMARSATMTYNAHAKMSQSATFGSKAASRFGAVAQQAGFQVQDFAVQIAAGQSALVALGQQGSQLLGIFGPTGAIAGAVLTVGVLAARFMTTADNTKLSKKAAEELKREYEQLDDRLSSVAEKWREINAGYATRANKDSPMDSEALGRVRAGIVGALPGMESDRLTLEGQKMTAQARAKDESRPTAERLKFNKQFVEFSEQEAAAQARILAARERVKELEKEIYDTRKKEVEAAWAESDAEREALRLKVEEGNKLYMAQQERMADARKRVDALTAPETPSALRLNLGASSLGGLNGDASSAITVQQGILDISRQQLAAMKQLLLYAGGN